MRGSKISSRRIERYAQRGREVFETDELLQTWIIHHTQIIGEAARKLTGALRSLIHTPLAPNHGHAQRAGARLFRG